MKGDAAEKAAADEASNFLVLKGTRGVPPPSLGLESRTS